MAVDRSLPFEMRALEGALANVSRLLTEEAASLEARAVPAADRLAKRVTCSSLKLATCPCVYSAADCLAKQVSLIMFLCVKGCEGPVLPVVGWPGSGLFSPCLYADRGAAKEKAYMFVGCLCTVLCCHLHAALVCEAMPSDSAYCC